MKKELILDDVIELTDIISKGLASTKLNEIIELYDCYRFLCIAIASGKSFQNGYFNMDIKNEIFQETESFLSPEIKWQYFTQQQLNKFNKDILKFIRSCVWTDFERDSYYDKILKYNLIKYSSYIPYENHDRKMKLSACCKEFEYEYMTFDLKEKTCSSMNNSNLCEVTTYDVSTNEEKNNLIIALSDNLKKLDEFKLFLEKYFLENGITKSLFCKPEIDYQLKIKGF